MVRSIRFTRDFIASGNGRRIEWVKVGPSNPKGVVFVPPLIGGDASQQVRIFRGLVRNELQLVTFSYAGHAGSSGIFSLKEAFRDTGLMLHLAGDLAARSGASLMGLAACFSAMPLIHAAASMGEPLHRLAFINPIAEISTAAVAVSFAAHYGHVNRDSGTIVGPGRALSSYLDVLFPGIERGRGRFGILDAGKTRLFRILSELLLHDPLAGLKIARTPVLCLYAREDRILNIFHRGERDRYESNWRSLCPQTIFRSVPGGHYMASAETRRSVFDSIRKFFIPAGDLQRSSA